MQTKLTDEVLVRVDALAAKLGVAAEHLWEIFTTQSVISGWSSLIVTGSVMLVALITFVVVIRRRMKGHLLWNDESKDGHPTIDGVLLWPSVAALFVTTMVMIVNASGWIAKILNPEYAAWREIKKLL